MTPLIIPNGIVVEVSMVVYEFLRGATLLIFLTVLFWELSRGEKADE
jgi:hypothetical protein